MATFQRHVGVPRFAVMSVERRGVWSVGRWILQVILTRDEAEQVPAESATKISCMS